MTSTENGDSRPRVFLDDILVEVGDFGRFQSMTLFLVAFPIVFSAFSVVGVVYTTAPTDVRCRIPECEGEKPEFKPPWLLIAIPGYNLFDCKRYGNNTVYEEAFPDPSCPAFLFNRTWTKDCTSFVYESKKSIVYDFDMGCDEWRRSMIGTLRMIGSQLGLPIAGYISDRWGRRRALSLYAFNTAWTGLVRSFVTGYEWFLSFEILEAFLGAGASSACFILAVELVSPDYRLLAGGVAETLFDVGVVLLDAVAWSVTAWRDLTRVIYGPQVFMIIYFWVLPESVRWILSAGRYTEAEHMLKKIAKMNKKKLSPSTLQALSSAADAENKMLKLGKPCMLAQIFKSRTILYRCFMCPIWWTTNMLIYYSMKVSSATLIGNSFLNYGILTAIEIFGILTTILLLNRIGRKPMIISGYWLCAACQFTFAFLPSGYDDVRPAFYIAGKYFISVVMTAVCLYTAELFPTPFRHTMFALSSSISRTGYIIAPLTPHLARSVWRPLPAVLFGLFALLSGALVFLAPETLGTKLPETIEDAELLGKKNSSLADT